MKYTIDIRLKVDDWNKNTFEAYAACMLTVYLIALHTARRRLDIQEIEFLPVGPMEYVIWGDKACQGFIGITCNDTYQSDVDGGITP